MNHDKNALTIISTLSAAGFEAYLVGGCVRDFLMGIKPKDFDIATSATPEEVESLFSKTVAVGKDFGVILVVIEGKEYEVATFRNESYYPDGRRPEKIVFSTVKEDVARRDFTINALLYDPQKDMILDFVGGEDDIKAGIIRTVGDPQVRFYEDHLRLLRAVRFAARTGFGIEQDTLHSMQKLAGLVKTVSAERTGEELLRMFSSPGAAKALELLSTTGLLIHVLPDVAAMHGMPQPEEFHPEGDVFMHTKLMFELLEQHYPEDPFFREVISWAVLLHDVAKPRVVSVEGRIRFNKHDELGSQMAVEILQSLKRPTKVIAAVRELIGRHMHFAHIKKMREAKRRRFLQDPLFPLHLLLHRLDCEGSHSILDNYYFGLNALAEENARPPVLEPILSGNDLISLGFSPGPLFKKILHTVEDLHLEEKLTTKEQAIKWVEEHYGCCR